MNTPTNLAVLTATQQVQPVAPLDLRTYASTTAQQYGLNADRFVSVLDCESGFDPEAIGDHGTSFGVVQIHMPAHPDITLEQATDPLWAINWAAEQWSKGNAAAWSCWVSKYGKTALD